MVAPAIPKYELNAPQHLKKMTMPAKGSSENMLLVFLFSSTPLAAFSKIPRSLDF